MTIQSVFEDAYRDLRVNDVERDIATVFDLQAVFLNHSMHAQEDRIRHILRIEITDLDNPDKHVTPDVVSYAYDSLAPYFMHEVDLEVVSRARKPREIPQIPADLRHPKPPKK